MAPNLLLPRPCAARLSRGVGMIELMISLTIGTVIVLGAVDVYLASSKTYATHEVASRLEENARFALSVIEPDVRMSNNWGLLKGAGLISNQSAQNVAANVGLAGAAATICGPNFAIDLQSSIEGSNDSYNLACAAYNGRPVTTADTLTVRHASFNPTTVPPLTVGPLRICSTRVSGAIMPVVVACPAVPTGRVYDLVVHTYYVAQDSITQRGLPALHRWSLNAVPTFQDDEILPGVEDLQVQFGVDPTGTTGVPTQYINPIGGVALPAGAQIVSVRIWVLVRAETAENGFVDSRLYQYGNRSAAVGTTNNLNTQGAAGLAYQPNDNFRRLLLSRTIMLRNALGT